MVSQLGDTKPWGGVRRGTMTSPILYVIAEQLCRRATGRKSALSSPWSVVVSRRRRTFDVRVHGPFSRHWTPDWHVEPTMLHAARPATCWTTLIYCRRSTGDEEVDSSDMELVVSATCCVVRPSVRTGVVKWRARRLRVVWRAPDFHYT